MNKDEQRGYAAGWNGGVCGGSIDEQRGAAQGAAARALAESQEWHRSMQEQLHRQQEDKAAREREQSRREKQQAEEARRAAEERAAEERAAEKRAAEKRAADKRSAEQPRGQPSPAPKSGGRAAAASLGNQARFSIGFGLCIAVIALVGFGITEPKAPPLAHWATGTLSFVFAGRFHYQIIQLLLAVIALTALAGLALILVR